MTLTLGRCSGLRPERGYPRFDGRSVQIQGVLQALTLDALKGARQQLLGMVDNEDEEVFPGIWASDSTFDGFYRPSRVDVEQIATTRTRALRFRASLERLVSYANPLYEVTVQSVLRTNTLGITAPDHIQVTRVVGNGTNDTGTLLLWAAPPATPSGFGGSSAFTSDGDSLLMTRLLSSTLLNAPKAWRAGWRPPNFYFGACRVEVLYGSTWVPVVGRSIPFTPNGSWRITNGLVRFTTNAVNNGVATIETWANNAGGAWESMTVHTADNPNGGIGWNGQNIITGIEILRNSPETVVVRMTSLNNQETFTLQRGHRHITWTQSPDQTGFAASSVQHGSATASTHITGGIRSTSNNGNGNRLVLGSPYAVTDDLVNGKITINGGIQPYPVTWMIAIENNGSAALAVDVAVELIDQFIGATSWRQRIVAP